MPSSAADKTHRTQGERSAQMKLRLLEATAQSLAENGYAATSTREVVDRAGVSRGALSHHFASKTDLVAEAAAHLIAQRIKSDWKKLEKLNTTDGDLHARIKLLWKSYQKTFPATIKYMVAARTDETLRKRFDEKIAAYLPPKSEPSSAWPELAGDSSPRLTQYVIGCFIRGLCLEAIVNDDALVEEIFQKFVALQEQGLPKTSPPGVAPGKD